MRKTINYDSVSRWTRLIDIFTRDFVIVPVNENLHWFVAIICNLSHFKRLKEKGNGEDDEGTQSSIIDDEGQEGQIENEEQLQAVIIDDEDDGNHSRRTKETQESFEELRIDDKCPQASLTVVSSSKAKDAPTPKGKRGRKQKPRRSLPKYDTDLPVIITFDSLGAARGNVSAALKQYVVLEALGKKEWEISDQEIKGMTAKNIPTQGNYSDCGLYMCMYLEQFMCDPYGFVEKILQREENQIRWPHRIRSEDLRARMRDLIMELHRQQEGEEAKGEIPSLGKILVDMREPSPEPEAEIVEEDPAPEFPARPIPDTKMTPEKIKAQKQRFTEHINKTASGDHEVDDGFEPEADDTPVSASQQKRFAEAARAQIDAPDDPIVIDDEGSPVKKKRKSQDLRSSPTHKSHTGPGELANNLRARRDRLEQKLAKRSTPAKEHRGNRSDSVSTDFMSGLQSYSNGHGHGSPERAARRGHGEESKKPKEKREPLTEIELPDEVPETQEQEQDEESQEERGSESESESESEVEIQELHGNLNGAGDGRKNRAERVPSEDLIEI